MDLQAASNSLTELPVRGDAADDADDDYDDIFRDEMRDDSIRCWRDKRL